MSSEPKDPRDEIALRVEVTCSDEPMTRKELERLLNEQMEWVGKNIELKRAQERFLRALDDAYSRLSPEARAAWNALAAADEACK